MVQYISNTSHYKESTFAGADREALFLDWHIRHQRPLCGGGQGEETIPFSHSTTHTQGCRGAAHSCKKDLALLFERILISILSYLTIRSEYSVLVSISKCWFLI